MGRRSIKENKNIYQQAREEMDLTREAAAELLGYISADRIEKIENEKSPARPDEVIRMAECYQKPVLCNKYCSSECPIGRKYVPSLELKDLSQITLEMLATLNTLSREKDRLVEITVDGEVSDSEMPDFLEISDNLNKMSQTISSLKLWVDSAASKGKLK